MSFSWLTGQYPVITANEVPRDQRIANPRLYQSYQVPPTQSPSEGSHSSEPVKKARKHRKTRAVSGNEARSPKSSKKSRKGNSPGETDTSSPKPSNTGPESASRSEQGQLVDAGTENEDVQAKSGSPQFEYVYSTVVYYPQLTFADIHQSITTTRTNPANTKPRARRAWPRTKPRTKPTTVPLTTNHRLASPPGRMVPWRRMSGTNSFLIVAFVCSVWSVFRSMGYFFLRVQYIVVRYISGRSTFNITYLYTVLFFFAQVPHRYISRVSVLRTLANIIYIYSMAIYKTITFSILSMAVHPNTSKRYYSCFVYHSTA